MCVSVQCKCMRERKKRETEREKAGEDDCLSCFACVEKSQSKCARVSVRMSFVEGFWGLKRG